MAKKRKKTGKKPKKALSAIRRRAGKKAAKTRAAKKAKRSAAAKKAANKRKRKGVQPKAKRRTGGKRGRKRGRKTTSRRRRTRRPLWRRYRGRTLKRARTNIKRARRGKMGRKARAYVRKFRMRTNPGLKGVLGMFKGVAKAVLPVAAGYVAARKAAAVVPSFGGSHAEPLKSAALLVGAHILTDKVRFLQKYKAGVMIGFGLALAKAIVGRYLPGVAGTLGLGEYIEMPGSVSDYVYQDGVGDYVDVSSDYSDVGALEELGNAGVMQEMGSLGAWNPKMLAGAIPTRGTAALIHHRANTMQVPAWAPASDEEWYQGVFANRLLRDA